jgi:hypothetical protein
MFPPPLWGRARVGGGIDSTVAGSMDSDVFDTVMSMRFNSEG